MAAPAVKQSWHFCNNDNIPHNTHRLAKIQPVIDYLQRKFNDIYKPNRQLSLDECIIPWRGRLSINTYNPVKITKYVILVRMLCEAVTGYTCNFHVYAADGKKLEDTVLTIIEPYENIWHQIYQDNYYNSVKMAKILLQNKVRVCGTIRKNRGLPPSLQTLRLSRGQHEFHYNRYMKGVDRADQYLTYYSIFRKAKKWTKRVVISAPTRRAPKLDNPGRLSNFRKHKLVNIVTSGRSVKPQRQCKVCAVQKKKK
ncbi:unnamed protein product [Heterotrigona itama]|uniref:PiggyBac transposable element-derived protein domain-containing protein n=1 Tax=Heterotrigona itama TaxID=395501 RepID=A0A6V7HGD3_9HYME|nr:unnamed protein product [Heterotrigona itama]